MKPRLLDVCSKAGGAAMGYFQAGFDVTCLDREPQPRCPFPFVRRDLRELEAGRLRETYDALHFSPPCQEHSDLAKRNGTRGQHDDYIEECRQIGEASGLPYVIENVEGAPLRDPVMLCGTMFPPLRVIRHRLFETNWLLLPPPRCGKHPLVYTLDKRKHHYGKLDEMTAFVQVNGGGNCTRAAAADAMGIDWMLKTELNQAIPPAYTRWIGRQMLAHIEAERIAA